MTSKSAFTLVELSIVLVILGLLVGGVLAGQNLIRAAELRSVTTEFANYQTAVMAFREKYFALPGDMDNATAFWGDQATGTGACADASVTDGTPGTCNGDGDGIVGGGNGVLTRSEGFRYWQHLANSGLIEGAYTGIAGPGASGREAIPGENVPEGRLSGSGWSAIYIGTDVAVDSIVYSGQGKQVLYFGTPSLFGGNIYETKDPIVTPEEAWNIDTKSDDGNPTSGKIINIKRGQSHTPNCTDDTTMSSDYDLTNTAVECAVIFMMD